MVPLLSRRPDWGQWNGCFLPESGLIIVSQIVTLLPSGDDKEYTRGCLAQVLLQLECELAKLCGQGDKLHVVFAKALLYMVPRAKSIEGA